MIKTSYFGAIKNLNIDDCVNISRFPPSWWNGKSLKDLSPKEELLFAFKNNSISKEVFEEEYTKQIEEYVSGRYEKLVTFLDGKILMCHEKSGQFCHRRIFAKIIKDKLGIEIEEVN